MLIFRLYLVMLLFFLAACANSPKQPDEVEKPITPARSEKPQPKIVAKDTNATLEPDVMFMLMTAELAGQRGQYDIALEGYLEAAKRAKNPRFAERAATIAVYLKNTAKTKEAVNLWLQQDADSLAARKIAALSALMDKDKASATGHLDVLLRLDPAGFEKTLLELVGVSAKERKSDFIYDVLDMLSARHPDNANVFYVKALVAVQENDTVKASSSIEKALNIQPVWDKALILKAQIALYSGDINKAVIDLTEAVARLPEDKKIKKLLAQLLIKAKNYPEAKRIYQALLEVSPEDAESRFALGLVYVQLGDDDSAEEVFTALLDQAQWQGQANFYLGKLEERRGNQAEALGRYNKVSAGPALFDAGIAAVVILAKGKQYQVADAKLSGLASQFPKQKMRLVMAKAELLSQQRLFQQAYDLLTDALAQAPDDKNLLYTRALMADRIGRLEVLESDLKKILAVDPDNGEALNALGYTLVEKTNRYAEAEQYLLRALKLSPDEAVILDSYGWLQFKRGDLLGALGYLQKAYEKQKENEITAHLAEVLWALGKQDEARKLIKDALKKAPDDEYLLEFKQRVLDK